MTRFFVSYNSADKGWAEWIAWTLEEAGHKTVIQAWDFRPGGNFVLDMQRAAEETDKTILVLSENYLAAEFTQPEWAAAFVDDPTSLERRVIPVRVQVCEPRGLLRPIVYVDLVGVEKEVARQRLLEALPERLKPEHEPDFPSGEGGTGKGASDRKDGSVQQPDFPNPAVSKPWNVPYDRNTFFTGRETVLEDLRSQLVDGGAAATAQAISGLGGIGKTQTAVEYAYRHRDDYSAVFWVRAETVAETQMGFVEIARLLDLPEKDEKDPNDTVQAVRRWLESNSGWLLVFDNADQPEQLKDFRPRQGVGNGSQHILLTSRAQTFDSVGIARPVSLAKMPEEEAVAFLFNRTGRNLDIEDSAEKTAAEALARELGYLPLALEQAGAYLLAQQMTFANYLKSYRKRKLALLAQKGPVTGDYPESVATTWALNFQAVEAASQAAADLLRVSAFLSPDAIPYELFEVGAGEMGDALAAALGDMAEDPAAFAEALAPLTRYSLVQAEPTMQAYSVARMVQEVQKAALTQENRRIWVERSIEAVWKAFPTTDYKNWPLIDRLLPHARVSVQLVSVYQVEAKAAANLLNTTGLYLKKRGLYDEVEPLYLQGIEIGKRSLGEDHPDVATSLANLASFYQEQGRYNEAEQLCLQGIEIDKRSLGEEHPDVAMSLDNLANLYRRQGRYNDAEPLFLQALELGKRSLGEDHIRVATSSNNLALLYLAQGRYSDAEPLFLQAIEIYKHNLGDGHPDVAPSLNNLANLYLQEGRYSDAEPLFLQALELGKRSLGEDHPAVATRLNNLANLYRKQRRYSDAEPLFLQAIEIDKHNFGEDHPDVATSLNNLAKLYYAQGRYDDAGPLFRQSLAIFEKALGSEHPSFQKVRNNLRGILTQIEKEKGPA
ncbi:MAG: FxSxx-COOH system tetratricopeptide repeat protein [Cyanobacteria bacterium P01_F01_bin.53]